MLTRRGISGVSSSVPIESNIPTYVPSQPTFTIETVLATFQFKGQPLFTSDQIKMLVSLHYKDSKNTIISFDDRQAIYVIYGIMTTEPLPSFDQLVEVLTNAKSLRDIIWSSPQLASARSTEVLKTNLQQGTFQITEAHKYCYRCKSKQNVLITYPQLRSADEPMTEIITCTNCGSRL